MKTSTKTSSRTSDTAAESGLRNLAFSPEPEKNCGLCPRLLAFRKANQTLYPAFFNGAVPSFGTADARLLVVGLAPGLKGANQTGRPFTGDYAGDLLYATLAKFGFTKGEYKARPDDGLELVDCMITNAVRCVPPQNKPVGPEIARCRPFLAARIAAQSNLKAIVALGRIAHEAVLRSVGARLADHKFAHGAEHEIAAAQLFDSYHCSRYNTNTGRLTVGMFEDVFRAVASCLETSA